MEALSGSLGRRWVTRDDKNISMEGVLKIATYNVLAEVYTEEAGMEYIDSHLSISERHDRIMRDILTSDPDVVCLQEVDNDHLVDRLIPDMTEHGYEGVGMSYKNKPHSADGLATFYRTRSVSLVSSKNSTSQDNIHNFIQRAGLSNEDRDAIQKLAERCQGVQVLRLEDLTTGKHITVGNIHAKWCEFKLPALSCLETICALQEVSKMARGGAYVLCGDFNSTPDYASYKTLRDGKFDVTLDHWNAVPDFCLYEWNGDVTSDPKDARVVKSDQALASVQGASRITTDQVDADKRIAALLGDVMSTPGPLRSAYLEVTRDEPHVTNCDGGAWPGWIHALCLDYVWYRPAQLKAVCVWEIPDIEQVRRGHGLPSTTLPSDHLLLAAGFRLL